MYVGLFILVSMIVFHFNAVGILLRNSRNVHQENLSDYTVDTLHDIIPLFNSCLSVYRD